MRSSMTIVGAARGGGRDCSPPGLKWGPTGGLEDGLARHIPAGRNVSGRSPCDPCRMALRCLIVDDSPRFVEAARGLMEREGIAVVGVASTSAEALRRAEEDFADLISGSPAAGFLSKCDLSARAIREILDITADDLG